MTIFLISSVYGVECNYLCTEFDGCGGSATCTNYIETNGCGFDRTDNYLRIEDSYQVDLGWGDSYYTTDLEFFYGDMDEDGLTEIYLGIYHAFSGSWVHDIRAFEIQTNGSLIPHSTYNLNTIIIDSVNNEWINTFALFDLDGDGKAQELIFRNNDVPTYQPHIYLWNNVTEQWYDTGIIPPFVESDLAVADLNNDGYDDYLTSTSASPYGVYQFYTNDQDNTFTQHSTWLAHGRGSNSGFDFIDVNYDGLLDVVACELNVTPNPDEKLTSVYLNTGTLSSPVFTYSSEASNLNAHCDERYVPTHGSSMFMDFLDYDYDGQPEFLRAGPLRTEGILQVVDIDTIRLYQTFNPPESIDMSNTPECVLEGDSASQNAFFIAQSSTRIKQAEVCESIYCKIHQFILNLRARLGLK